MSFLSQIFKSFITKNLYKCSSVFEQHALLPVQSKTNLKFSISGFFSIGKRYENDQGEKAKIQYFHIPLVLTDYTVTVHQTSLAALSVQSACVAMYSSKSKLHYSI